MVVVNAAGLFYKAQSQKSKTSMVTATHSRKHIPELHSRHKYEDPRNYIFKFRLLDSVFD